MTRAERAARRAHVEACREMNCYPKPVWLWLADYRRAKETTTP